MNKGIGIYIARVVKSQDIIKNDLAKYLTEHELNELKTNKHRNNYITKRLVAKKAFIKAFYMAVKCKMTEGKILSMLEVIHDKRGCPGFKFFAELKVKLINAKTFLTLTDEDNYVLGCVVIEMKQ